MFTIDLSSLSGRQRSAQDSARKLFDIGADLAHFLPDVCVRVAVGPAQEDRAILDGRLLSQDGVKAF